MSESTTTTPRTRASNRALAAAAFAATVLFDQATKLASTHAPRALAGLNFPTRNRDLSLGLASGPWAVQVALMGAALLAVAAVLTRAVSRGKVPGWAAGLLIGGALSNLVDRALLGSVRDFLHLVSRVVSDFTVWFWENRACLLLLPYRCVQVMSPS
jgi:lipoprotein signal peptidase